MYQSEAYAAALLFMIGSMLCWGSWANHDEANARLAFLAVLLGLYPGNHRRKSRLGFYVREPWRRPALVRHQFAPRTLNI
jgi:hypothetical protein